jgi:hypothetical protein
MPTPQVYAILNDVNTVVVNTIIADAAFVAANYPAAIRIDTITPQPGIGWTFAAGVFSPPAPVAPPAPLPSTVFTRLQFRQIFTQAEIQALDNVATSGLSAAVKAAVNTYMTTFAQADLIDLTTPYVATAINAAATAGLITPARAAAILATTH